eukprot:SAG11_NODE_45109_length_148_cov_15.693878_1_plen_40_part_01
MTVIVFEIVKEYRNLEISGAFFTLLQIAFVVSGASVLACQ